jgi:hypothetical protein
MDGDTAGNIGLELNLRIKQGSDFTVDVECTTANDLPFDFAPYSHVAHLRKRPFATPVQSFVCTSPVLGTLRFHMDQADTALLKCGPNLDDAASSYVWDHELVLISSGVTSPGFYGDVSVFRDI